MSHDSRRVFMLKLASAGATVMAAQLVHAQAALVNEKDAQAVSLGYVSDTNKADAKKYPKHANTQQCGNCQLFAGKPADASGGCAIFPGKAVSAKGWCSAYVKKAA